MAEPNHDGDYVAAKEYIVETFRVRQLIIDHMRDQASDAIAQFDMVSDIPETSSGWTWEIASKLIETALKLVPQAKVLQLTFKVVGAIKTASDITQKAEALAKEAGITLFQDNSKPVLQPPPEPTAKDYAVKALDGVGNWQTTATALNEAYRAFLIKLLDALEKVKLDPKNKKSKLKGRLKATIEQILGPMPVYVKEDIDNFGTQFELGLYKHYYAPGAYIARAIVRKRPDQYGSYSDTVKGVKQPILDRIKFLKGLPTEVAAVADWNLQIVTKIQVCNYCHDKPGKQQQRDLDIWAKEKEPFNVLKPKNDIDWRLRRLPPMPAR